MLSLQLRFASFAGLCTLAVGCGVDAPSQLAFTVSEAARVCGLMPESLTPMTVPLGLADLTGGLNEQEYDDAIDRVTAMMAPIVANHGAQLKTDKLWTSPTTNAFAQQLPGINNQWRVEFHGGLARMGPMTVDAMSLVTCHEIGHHLAGFPLHGVGFVATLASEGQADYFTIKDCARRLWQDDAEINAKFAQTSTPQQRQECDAVFTDVADKHLCYREMVASQDLANTLAVMRNEFQAPTFAQRDVSEVSATFTDHPASQCRLDTYRASTICKTEQDMAVIPGLKEFKSGASMTAIEQASIPYACHDELTTRPSCWFKSVLTTQPTTQPAQPPATGLLGLTIVNVDATETFAPKNGFIDPNESLTINAKILNGGAQTVTLNRAKLQWGDADPIATDEGPFELAAGEYAITSLSGLAPSLACGTKTVLRLAVHTNLGSAYFERPITMCQSPIAGPLTPSEPPSIVLKGLSFTATTVTIDLQNTGTKPFLFKRLVAGVLTGTSGIDSHPFLAPAGASVSSIVEWTLPSSPCGVAQTFLIEVQGASGLVRFTRDFVSCQTAPQL